MIYKQIGSSSISLRAPNRVNFSLIEISVNRFYGSTIRFSLLGFTLVLQLITEKDQEAWRRYSEKLSKAEDGWEDDDV